MQEKKVLSEKEKECLKSDILLDIYYYEKALEKSSLRKEEEDSLKSKLKDAEELYNSI